MIKCNFFALFLPFYAITKTKIWRAMFFYHFTYGSDGISPSHLMLFTCQWVFSILRSWLTCFALKRKLGKTWETFDRKRKFVMEFSSLGGSYYTLSDKNLSLIILWNLFLGLLAHITFDTSALIKNMYETESKMSIELLQDSFFHVFARFRLIEFDRKTSFFRTIWRHKLRLVSSSLSSSLRILSNTKSATLKINCTLECDASTAINLAPFRQNSYLNKLLHAFRSMQNILTRKKQKKNIIKATPNMFYCFWNCTTEKGFNILEKG